MLPEPSQPRLDTPLRIFLLLLLIIFVVEALVMFILPHLFPHLRSPYVDFTDAFLLSALSAPFIWALIARPLQSNVKKELARINAVLGFLAEAVVSVDERGVVESLNPAAEKMFGYEFQEVVGEGLALLIPEIGADSPAGVLAQASARRKNSSPESWETTGRNRHGMLFPVAISVSRLQQGGGTSFIAIIHDESERKKTETLIMEQKEFVESMVQSSAVPLFVLNAHHEVLTWNRACEELTGVKAEEMLHRNEPWKAFYDSKRPVLADIVIDGDLERATTYYGVFGRSALIPEGLQAEGWYPDLNGMDRYIFFNAAPIRNSKGELLGVIESLEDITGRKRNEERLKYQATHDGLTDLPNRNLLEDRIQQALFTARRNREKLAVFFIDLDNFKFVNDARGHEIGDLLLKNVASRLKGFVRGGDTVARYGADEFVIVVSALAEIESTAQVARKIHSVFSDPFGIEADEFLLTCSIGISIFPKDGEDGQTLLKNADIAKHRAKEQGRNNFQFFTDEMNARTLTRITMENLLRHALEKNELLLHYQPKVNLLTGRVTGVEALARWQSPELGMVSPANFIPLAEETGLIEPIGEWVLKTACKQSRSWQDAGFPHLTMAVNLSARQFRQKNIIGVVGNALEEAGLSARFLEIEITESLVMHDVEWAVSTLNELKGMGISLAMDDFGTGYSSLGYLKRFPFDKLKIDQSFVRDITSDPDSAAIARGVIAMAHSLHLKVIAEGVETTGQLNYLILNGCDEMQGYFFSRPLPHAEFGQLLREERYLPLPTADHVCQRRTLLIVDDEEDVSDALAEMLAFDGYHVLTANGAAAAFDLLASHRVGVVLADQRMPRMTGSEFLGRVKELYPDTVRLILTAYADLDTVTDAINLGAIYKFLCKPWKEDDIREKIADAFRYHESQASG